MAAETRTALVNVGIKRVYEPIERNDGLRVLVDRLWPRGLSKDAAQIENNKPRVSKSGYNIRTRIFNHLLT